MAAEALERPTMEQRLEKSPRTNEVMFFIPRQYDTETPIYGFLKQPEFSRSGIDQHTMIGA
jgi:hypothetical protein